MTEQATTEYPYVYMHYGFGGCNRPAYHMLRKVESGEVLEAKDFRNLDGSEVDEGKPILCGACHAPIERMVTNFIVEVRHDRPDQD